MEENRRIFIGELFAEITESDLSKRFSHFGKVKSVEIHVKKDEMGKPLKTFAFLDMDIEEKNLKSCISLMNKSKWKSKVMSVQIAKTCFYQNLLKQIAENQQQKSEPPKLVKPENVKCLDMKSAVPGTKVPGLKKWVVSKYGRALPIVYIRRKDKKKIMMVDPSKYCHNIKQFKEETSPNKVKKLNTNKDRKKRF